MKVTFWSWYIVAGSMKKTDLYSFDVCIYSKKRDHKFFEKSFFSEIIKTIEVERYMISLRMTNYFFLCDISNYWDCYYQEKGTMSSNK